MCKQWGASSRYCLICCYAVQPIQTVAPNEKTVLAAQLVHAMYCFLLHKTEQQDSGSENKFQPHDQCNRTWGTCPIISYQLPATSRQLPKILECKGYTLNFPRYPKLIRLDSCHKFQSLLYVYLPVGELMQTPPGSTEYFPTGQSMQTDEPILLAVYFPTSQFVQEFAPPVLYQPMAR